MFPTLLSLVGCFDTWYKPYIEPVVVGPLSLPTIEYALTISSKDLFQVPRENNTLDRRQEQNCSTSDATQILPYEQLKPLVLSVEIDQIQVDGKTVLLDNLTIDPPTSKQLTNIPSLYDVMFPLYESTAKMLYPCGRFNNPLPHTLLITVDERVSTAWLFNIIYTLGQTSFSNFAFLVHDPEPSTLGDFEFIGGLNTAEDDSDEVTPWDDEVGKRLDTSVQFQGIEHLSWKGSDGLQHQSRMTDIPRFLGYEAPPTITLITHPGLYVQSWMQGYNALYKSGVYCIDSIFSIPSSNKDIPLPTATLRSDTVQSDSWNDTETELPVILFNLPSIGQMGIKKRIDGVQCATRRKREKRENIPETKSTGLLESIALDLLHLED